jgi:phosphatidylglycerophosphatase A
MINKIGKTILTMFGIGYFKYAPGTVASFITCLIFYSLASIDGINQIIFPYIIFLIIIFIYSTILIDKIYKKEDSKEIVIDEFIGQSIPLLAISTSNELSIKLITFLDNISSQLGFNWFEISILISFILFRFFDILKPFPINLIDKKIKNSFGVILDDVVAGIFATISLYIILLWI